MKDITNRNADRILRKIKQIPGANTKNQSVDERVFWAWIDETETLSKQKKYHKAHICQLGTILSYSPLGSDNVWPTECVRRCIEKYQSKDLENAFATGRINQRGIYSPTEGRSEKDISEKYEAYARKLEFQYPHTAKVLRDISYNYKRQSNREWIESLNDY